jgi:hypothetical protein
MKRLTGSFVQSETAGNLAWSICNGTLTVGGTGDMPDCYYQGADVPWKDYTTGINRVIINDGVTGIGRRAFAGCRNLASVTIPGSVTSIKGGAFAGCHSLISISIPESVTGIGGSAFAGCRNLTAVSIPNGVTTIRFRVFADCCNLTSVAIPNSVTSIEGYAFADCSGLTAVTLPSRVTAIEGYAFRNCRSLTAVEAGWSSPFPSAGVAAAFYGVNVGNCTLFVPPGAKALYEAAAFWRDFGKITEKAAPPFGANSGYT